MTARESVTPARDDRAMRLTDSPRYSVETRSRGSVEWRRSDAVTDPATAAEAAFAYGARRIVARIVDVETGEVFSPADVVRAQMAAYWAEAEAEEAEACTHLAIADGDAMVCTHCGIELTL